MFFCLTIDVDPRFPEHWNLGNLILNTDAGWHRIDANGHVFIYKGYADHLRLHDNLFSINDNQQEGNFCIFDYDISNGLISIKTSLYRSFIIWHDRNKHCLTNFDTGPSTIWTDSTISVDQDLEVYEDKIDLIGNIDTKEISKEELIDRVHRRLTDRVQSFLNNNDDRPLRVFCSGGIDSMLVFSYIKSNTDRFEMVYQNHVDWDIFWCRNQNHIRNQFWAYQQIHHWARPCFLSSGAPGDEFMLRSPVTANLWLKHHGTSILQELEKNNGDLLHRRYFNRTKHIEIFKQQDHDDHYKTFKKSEMYRELCNNVANDCQHWHLGNTLTFTPLRDLKIFKMFLRLPVDDGLGQILNSSISKELIALNDPDLLNYLSDVKNTGECLANLAYLMSKYPATSGQ